MMRIYIGLIWLSLCFMLDFASGSESDVLVFTDGDFDTNIADHNPALVMFFAPWCGHCKKLKPEFEKAAGILRNNDPPVYLVKVDCTEAGKETCNRFSVSGYPTLKIFRGSDETQDYNGPREASGIVKYMKGQVGPSSKELKSLAELEDFISKYDDVGIVGFFENDDSSLKSVYLKTAEKLRESIRFAHTLERTILDKHKLKNHIVLFRPKHLHSKLEPNSVEYSGKESKDAIEEWITSNYHGLCGHRFPENAREFKSPVVIVYYSVDFKKNAKGTNYWRNRIMKVAKDYSDEFKFAVSSKSDFQHELNEFGIDYSPDDKPIATARNDKGQKFVLSGEFSVDTFEKFLKDLKVGALEPFLKSEEIPDDNSGPVKVAVAKNFDEVVNNNDKDTLIEFYAPWCGHCKKLAPTLDQLGEKLKQEDVSIVKMDATANDVPQAFQVQGFPTLYWASKSNKSKPVKYEGGRDLSDFIKYIAKHASNELNGWDRAGNEKKKESDAGDKEEL